MKVKPEPTNHQLLCWWLFWKLDETPHVDSPDVIDGWINELSGALMDSRGSNRIYKKLYDGYEEFKEKFAAP